MTYRKSRVTAISGTVIALSSSIGEVYKDQKKVIEMNKTRDFSNILVKHVNIFQYHPHPVVHILMKGFSRVLVRDAFSRILAHPAATGPALPTSSFTPIKLGGQPC